ncbi:unnamed protein product [Euphydryas editha]|uniref:Defensin n=1 Tax=Euphydryas editha TaxID=104508 RepID=A0AAU9U0W9_EUPED|nr:unnamed protein product [Euphydryas editha]
MAIKTFPLLLAVLAVLLVAHTVSSEDVDRSDLLFIENPDTNPEIISPARALLDSPTSRRRVCTAAMCQRVCRALYYRFGRCNINRICVCSNF